MAVTKDPEHGTWTVQCWYRDWQGARRKKTKRGFKSQRSAFMAGRDVEYSRTHSREGSVLCLKRLS